MSVYNELVSWRDRCRDWIEAGDKYTTQYRIEAAAWAIGVSDDLLVRYLYQWPGPSFGYYLAKELVEWVDRHPDITHNNRADEQDRTAIAHVRIN